TGARTVFRRREQQATVAAQVWDALSRKQPELPAQLLVDTELTAVRRQVDLLDGERLHGIEAPLVRDALAAVASERAARSIVEVMPNVSRNALEIVRAQPTVEAHIVVDGNRATADAAAGRFGAAYPDRTSAVVVSDPVITLNLPRGVPRPAFVVCLGGAISRFTTISAIRLLRSIRSAMAPHDRLMLGVDLRAGAALEEHHQHERQLRERAQLLALTAVNRACGANFDATNFRYYARYDAETKRLNVGVECVRPASVRVGTTNISLSSGTVIQTGVHCGYDRRALHAMLLGVGLIIDTWHEHGSGEYAVATVLSVHCDARG
ncbi:MAG: L-histidine N(alpha)-methyltransferase, partial [Gemmatimonadota bacterium]